MEDLLKIKLNLNTKRDLLKLALDQKEIVQYSVYKQSNIGSKDRSAMDKVVARLKLEDETWLEQEEELVRLKTLATVVDNIVEINQAYLNQGIDIDDVEASCENYINEFNLGEWL
jgi:hypothetical protein